MLTFVSTWIQLDLQGLTNSTQISHYVSKHRINFALSASVKQTKSPKIMDFLIRCINKLRFLQAV